MAYFIELEALDFKSNPMDFYPVTVNIQSIQLFQPLQDYAFDDVFGKMVKTATSHLEKDTPE